MVVLSSRISLSSLFEKKSNKPSLVKNRSSSLFNKILNYIKSIFLKKGKND
jgi:hypothetical protein